MTPPARFSQLRVRTRLMGGASLATGLVGILASSCCLLPLVLAGLGLGSVAAAVIPTLAQLRPYLLGAAAIAVTAAWVSLYWHRDTAVKNSACAPVARRRIPPLLAAATIVAAIAVLWRPLFEPQLLTWFR